MCQTCITEPLAHLNVKSALSTAEHMHPCGGQGSLGLPLLPPAERECRRLLEERSGVLQITDLSELCCQRESGAQHRIPTPTFNNSEEFLLWQLNLEAFCCVVRVRWLH